MSADILLTTGCGDTHKGGRSDWRVYNTKNQLVWLEQGNEVAMSGRKCL